MESENTFLHVHDKYHKAVWVKVIPDPINP
jgi:hypothetical protein